MAHHDVQHFGKNPALPALSQGIYTSDRTDQQKPVSFDSAEPGTQILQLVYVLSMACLLLR